MVVGLAAGAWARGEPVEVEASWDEQLAASLQGSIASGQVWIALLAAWVGGLLTSFTPCVWPLIPITVRFFGAMKDADRKQVFRLALVYVGGMMVLYSTLGVIFASLGKLHGSLLGSPWFTGAIALFCVLMGLSMLGVFTIQLPASLATKLSQVGGRTYGGALAMGLVSGLIAAPCTGPVLAVVLALIATTGRIFVGFWLMVAFSLGLGLPFIVIAMVSGKKIPGSGLWMDVVKTVLATAMFDVGIYFLQLTSPTVRDLLRALPFGALGGLLLIILGLIVGAFLFNLHGRPAGKIVQGTTIFLLTIGVAIATMGSKVTTTDPGVPTIKWTSSHDVGIARARAQNLPVFIDFTAEWCTACKELDRKTFVDEKVRAEATRFVTLKIDATRQDEIMEALFERYGVRGLPAVVFVDSSGTILKEPRVTGFVPAARFLEMMRSVH
ncbi:protein-disulfide reductase DsbD family protein [Myxococcota bacterium]